jgi:hypothetical protein
LLKLRTLESQESKRGTDALGLVHPVVVSSSGCHLFLVHTVVHISGSFLCLLLMHALKMSSACFWLQKCNRLVAEPCELLVACCQSAYSAFLASASWLARGVPMQHCVAPSKCQFRPLGLVHTVIILCMLLVHANFVNAIGWTLCTSLSPIRLLLSIQFDVAYCLLKFKNTQSTHQWHAQATGTDTCFCACCLCMPSKCGSLDFDFEDAIGLLLNHVSCLCPCCQSAYCVFSALTSCLYLCLLLVHAVKVSIGCSWLQEGCRFSTLRRW